jgi:hypothetical protein
LFDSESDRPKPKPLTFRQKITQSLGNLFIEVGSAMIDASHTDTKDEFLDFTVNNFMANLTSVITLTKTKPNDFEQTILSDDYVYPIESKDLVINTQQQQEEIFYTDFSYLFEEQISLIDDALDILNSHASELNYKYNKGPWSNTGNNNYFSLYCVNKLRTNTARKKNQDEYDSPNDEVNVSKKLKTCESFYRFKLDRETRKYF